MVGDNALVSVQDCPFEIDVFGLFSWDCSLGIAEKPAVYQMLLRSSQFLSLFQFQKRSNESIASKNRMQVCYPTVGTVKCMSELDGDFNTDNNRYKILTQRKQSGRPHHLCASLTDQLNATGEFE